MKYTLNNLNSQQGQQKTSFWPTVKKFIPYLKAEKVTLAISFVAILVNSGLTILAPIIIGHTVDTYITTRQFHGVLVYSSILVAVYLGALVASFIQTRLMGGVGQRTLFRLRVAVFNKLQELPVAFFNQNKAGDLISRINNDTDKLNQFFSQSLMQFIGNVFVIIGAAIAMVTVNTRLGTTALIPAIGLLIFTQLTSAWIKKQNFKSLQAMGGLSAEVQESLDNFKVIVAFNRRDYFKERFTEVNDQNYKTAVRAGIANNTYTPIYGLASNAGSLIIIVYGLWLISQGSFTFGLLVSYLAYVSRFYDPLRQMAALWANLQAALAGWDRISEILAMESDLPVFAESKATSKTGALLEFQDVAFGYPDGKPVLSDVSLSLHAGKTYALVGPTGGGKTTTASLMARLYDPTEGTVLLNGKDIRTYTTSERTKQIGFILQEPFLFTGTVGQNILYGNEEYQHFSTEELAKLLKKEGLDSLLARFDQGLDTPVSTQGETISLGQKQLIAFMRAVLRHPSLLILDEATANIDTVTEQLLEEILKKLPKETTKVIIAHRLNTIENADEIFFVNSGQVISAGSLEQAVEMLTSGVRES